MSEEDHSKSAEEETSSVCSPKPLAFTIDFGEGKSIDLQRHKTLFEKYKNRHKRGQSLSKIETKAESIVQKKHPSSGNLPRKSSFQSDGYFSSDEKSDKTKIKTFLKRDLSLQLKNATTNKMTQSFPSSILSDIISPEIEIKDTSSPELDLISPISPQHKEELPLSSNNRKVNFSRQHSSPESATLNDIKVVDLEDEHFVDGTEFDFDRSDTVSDAGTYTLDADNYSEAQKLRMSIDREFKIEHMSGIEKTQEYIRSLANFDDYLQNNSKSNSLNTCTNSKLNLEVSPPQVKSLSNSDKLLSPILSPTQNLSITESIGSKKSSEADQMNETYLKTSSEKPKKNEVDMVLDRGSVISVTSSGVFRTNKEPEKKRCRKLSLTKSEIQVEDYIDDKNKGEHTPKQFSYKKVVTPKLSANVINVQNISIKSRDMEDTSDVEEVKSENISYLPPAVGGLSGNSSPSKIPSPVHTLSRPRSRNSYSSQNIDLSDSSIETESYLKSTQSCINSLQKRLSLDSDQDSDLDNKYEIALNNTAQSLLKQRTSHTRHNSLDGRAIKISNKLEHFQSKNLQGIDQTYMNKFNQCSVAQVMHKIQNSPNNSPIRRSSSFSTKNQVNSNSKNTNIQNELNYNELAQKNSSPIYLKSGIPQKPALVLDHPKIDRNKFGDTESSSEEDFEKNLAKKKDTSLTKTRYNRAFSLRRGRLESEPSNSSIKCPNTPEVRRKFMPERAERAISVDRKPTRTEIQSRYMTNISKKVSSPKLNIPKNVPKTLPLTPKQPLPKAQVMSRTDSGRFSMRIGKGPIPQKSPKDMTSAKKSGGRSNSSLTSREVDFQNWKRRKSYDPIKAAAEGKRKEMEKRQGIMTQSYNEKNHTYECDSSPSHSSSVHRSQVSFLNNKVDGNL
ncbi:uncharacterized protein LOC123309519 isoform X2 [Coccinella septempunctata]|uniref:uncharacterized protein LOC123309519 isoform X2 n=1 Tax=Coccinella septempunctata TaxID=41139 RepID=UPI001D091B50|nr:uncharacterized protein LOC123309519 isoform X2 [Coccinella septempunctata]